MPSLQTARRVANAKNNGAKTIGQIYKEQSDFLMEETFWNDPQSKVCYIYDYFHDDQPDKNVGMTYENTTKTKIDAKFIVKTYQSIDKDQVEYYIQFKPSQKTRFEEGDELYYFETDYRRKYGVQDFPIGLMIDIPDDTGLYHKWLICSKEPANQFVKYLVLPCNYFLHWVENDGQNRYKRSMWVVLRNQNSYTIGQYTDRYFTRPDNQFKLWAGLNTITESFWYNSDDTKTMRLVVSAPTKNVLIWSVTKIENAQPIGLQKLTLYQTSWNEHTDGYAYDEYGNYVPYANYYDSNIEPTDPDTPSPTPSNTYGKITASTSTIKVGGSYKTLTLKLYGADGNEITDNYSSYSPDDFKWTCSITNGNKTIDLSDVVSWYKGKEFNQKKIKFPDNRDYLGKVLDVKCAVDGIETVEKFEIII